WKQFTPEGYLQYPNFLETVTQIIPMYAIRGLGGTLYLLGFCIMVYNIFKTMASGKLVANEAAVVAELPESHSTEGQSWHRRLEGRPLTFTLWTTVAILIGGIVEFVPAFLVKSNVPTIAAVKPYTPLELHGRDIYVKEGCVG